MSARVVDATGAAVAGARAIADGEPARELPRGSDAGLLTLPGDLAGACVHAPGRAPSWLRVAGGGSEAVVTLAPSPVLAGTLLTTSGQPVPGQLLRATPLGAPASCATEATTDASGRFRFDAVVPGNLRLELAGTPAVALPDERVVRVPASGEKRVELAARPLIALAGAVTAAGKPVPDARVTMVPDWPRSRTQPPFTARERRAVEQAAATTAKDGAFSLGLLPQRPEYRVAVRHPGYAPRSVRVRGEQAAAQATVPLGAGATIALRAVDAEGAPWRRPQVRLFSEDAVDLDLMGELPAGGEDGKLTIEHVPPGHYSVELRASGARPRTLRGVALADGRVAALGDVVLEPGADVAGVVSTASGAPLDGVTVRLSGWAGGRRLKLETEPDGRGRFRFEGLDPETRADVLAEGDGWLTAREEGVLPGTEDLELELDPAAVLEVTAVDGETGDALASFSAELLGEEAENALRPGAGRRPTGVGAETAEAEDGVARFKRVTPGEWRVRVRAPGYAPQTSEKTRFVAEREPVSLEVALSRGATIAGKVVDADARSPVGGALVTATLGDGAEVQARAQVDGSFALEGLTGPADITASAPTHVTSEPVTVDPAATKALELPLDRGGSVEGTVTSPLGEPLAGAEVSLQGRAKSALTDASGRYRLDGLPPGLAKLSKVDRPRTFQGMEDALVEVTKGQVARHDFGGGPRLVGTITWRGEPVAGAALSSMKLLSRGQAAGFSARSVRGLTAASKDDGSYAMAGFEPGAWALTVKYQGRSYGVEVDYPEGQTELKRDLEIPDLRLSGVVVDASSRQPVAGVSVNAEPGEETEQDRMRMAMIMRSSEGDGDELLLSSTGGSSDETGQDGRFTLLVPRPGKWNLVASRGMGGHGNEPNVQALEVTASRDDIVLEVPPEDPDDEGARGQATVRLVDAATGEPLRGIVAFASLQMMAMGSSGDAAVKFPDLATENPWTFIVLKEGRAPGVLTNVRLSPGEDKAVDVPGTRGGDLRLLVPEGVLTASPMTGIEGPLRLMTGGFDLMSLSPVRANHVARNVSQGAPGEWILRKLPEGPLTVVVGEGDAARTASVEVREGVEAVADLR